VMGPVEPPHADRRDSEILASFTPPQIMRQILGRMVQTLAASSHFSIPRLSDLAAANDAIASYVETAANAHVEVTIAPSLRRLAMRTGPLPASDPALAEQALSGLVDELQADREKLLITLLDTSR
jgi:hypothetical protein